ncbi:hypothetical protein PM035_12875 [Halorubrum ezzemoulense]|uniref:hypothetical protein n=1 Tax=Halorubrum ezzemoulense TaxID=337243 RepID=UPI00233109AB|nr:hypothetical protein [Halorubrum ezzemoulense]MDB2261819.1 hypothetical protein [Halorubrum ezzemoulense]MDB2268581.1 hypothetical protein [Halorubrum ezzemoulense]
MAGLLSESEIYVYSKRFLRNHGWKLVGGEPPGGSDGLPRVEAKHPDKDEKGSRGSKKVDILAYKGGKLLLLELKSRYDEGDVVKLDELVGELRWRRALHDACLERNAFQRAGVADGDLPHRVLSGAALVKGIGIGHHHGVPEDYVRLTLHAPNDIDVWIGSECRLDFEMFDSNE